MGAQAGSGSDGQPVAIGWGAICGFVAVDQAEAGFAFVRLDIEADSSAVGQLWVATNAHQLASVGILLAFQEQLSDPMLQQINLGAFGISRLGRERRQLGDITPDSFCKLDLDLRSGFAAHGLPDVDAQLAERAGTVLSPLGRTAADPLGGESLNLIVGLPIVKDRDLATHLMHLRFEVTQFLEELPGSRSGQKRHQNQDTGGVRRKQQTLVISQAMCLLTS